MTAPVNLDGEAPALPPPEPPVRARITSSAMLALKTAVVASGCYTVAPYLGLREAYWSAVSCIIVMQAEVTSSLTAARDRVLGTAIGGVLGWGCAVLWGGDVAIYAVAVLLAIALCGALGLAGAGRISGVTVTIVALLPHTGPAWLVSLHRLLGVSFGVVVGLAAVLASDWIEKTWRARGS